MKTDQGPPDAETEIERARAGLGRANFGHALRHLAAALAHDPTHGEALQILDEVLEAAGARALGLLRVEDETFFGVAALRAYALARRGRALEGLAILIEVAQFRPDIPYLTWAERWFPETHAAPGRRTGDVDPDEIGGHAVSFLEPLSPSATQHEGVRRNLDALLVTLSALRARYPEAQRLTYAAIFSLRRLGRPDIASTLARQWFAARPSWIGAVTAANAHRDAGAVDAAIAYYRRAQELRPSDVSPLLDMGDLLLDTARPAEAAEAYSEALAGRPSDSWAEPSLAYARLLETHDPVWRGRLEALARQAPSGSRARHLIERLAGSPP